MNRTPQGEFPGGDEHMPIGWESMAPPDENLNMNTVNVVEIPNTNYMNGVTLIAFPDTEEGNKEAEALFTKLVNENTYFDENEKPSIEECINDGYFEAGTYWVGLVHSNPNG